MRWARRNRNRTRGPLTPLLVCLMLTTVVPAKQVRAVSCAVTFMEGAGKKEEGESNLKALARALAESVDLNLVVHPNLFVPGLFSLGEFNLTGKCTTLPASDDMLYPLMPLGRILCAYQNSAQLYFLRGLENESVANPYLLVALNGPSGSYELAVGPIQVEGQSELRTALKASQEVAGGNLTDFVFYQLQPTLLRPNSSGTLLFARLFFNAEGARNGFFAALFDQLERRISSHKSRE